MAAAGGQVRGSRRMRDEGGDAGKSGSCHGTACVARSIASRLRLAIRGRHMEPRGMAARPKSLSPRERMLANASR